MSAVLTLIVVSGRFIKYLSYAAAGDISPEFVFQSVAYRVPGMMILILPLGLFLGILLSYGRMYLESEMVVLKASGVSTRRLSLYALGPSLGMALLVGLIAFYISPLCWKQVDQIYIKQSEMSELDRLAAGRFQTFAGGARTTYTSGIKANSTELDLVFVSERDKKTGELRVVIAKSGEQVKIDPDSTDRFVVLKNGYRYEGVPGEADYRQVGFAEYGFLMPQSSVIQRAEEIQSMTVVELLSKEGSKYQSELHWRLSMPLLVCIIALIAVPMSKTNPRQGRYAKLIPSILLYMFYLTLLTSAKGAIDDGDLPVLVLWLIHFAFFLLAMSLLFADRFWERLGQGIPSLATKKKVSV